MKTLIAALMIASCSSAMASDLTPAKYPTTVLCEQGHCGPGHEKMINEAKGKFASLMREPESVRFENVYLTTGKDMESLTVCGTVQGRNGFGGMSFKQRFFVTEMGKAMITERRRNSLLLWWRDYCDPQGSN